MIVNQKRDIKLIVAQFGAALAVSLAGFLYSRVKNRRRSTKPSLPPLKIQSSDNGSDSEAGSRRGRAKYRGHLNTLIPKGDKQMQKNSLDNSMAGLSPSCRYSKDDRDGFLLPEFNDVVKEIDMPVCRAIETAMSDSSASLAFPSEEFFDYEKEIMRLQSTVRMLKEKERDLEAKLQEYYSLKEQQKVAMELQNRLKLNQMETKLFNLKIESLQSENRRLGAQVVDHANVVSELEAARSQSKLLKKKLRAAAEQNKEQIMSLQERVTKLHEQEPKGCETDPDSETMRRRLKDLEAEVNELREFNTELQQENSDLAERLESTQILASSRLEDSEMEALNQLKHENEHLKREIEKLQADRCSDLEELVYLKWINACLRYELRNYQPPPGKAIARDLNKSLSHRSEGRAKQLIIEYAHTEGFDDRTDFDNDRWSSSQESFVTESVDLEDSPIETSAASKTHKPGKRNHLLRKLREAMHGGDAHHQNHHNHHERPSSPEHRGAFESTSSTGVQTTPESQDHKFEAPRPKSRHSVDFQLLMRHRGEESKDVGNGSQPKPLYRTMVLGGQDDTNSENKKSEATEKSELIKYADALNHHAPKKLYTKAASYCFGDTHR